MLIFIIEIEFYKHICLCDKKLVSMRLFHVIILYSVSHSLRSCLETIIGGKRKTEKRMEKRQERGGKRTKKGRKGASWRKERKRVGGNEGVVQTRKIRKEGTETGKREGGKEEEAISKGENNGRGEEAMLRAEVTRPRTA